MITKINSIRNKILPDGIMLSSWLSKEGITRAEQSSYTKRETLERVTSGIYKFPDSKLSLYGILTSYKDQGTIDYHLGASTALEIKGFSHYILMGKQKFFLFTQINHRLPKWIRILQNDIDIIELSTHFLGNYGIEKVDLESYRLNISSPERAIMECILLSPKYFNLIDIYYMMEMMTNLRSKLIQELLDHCSSIKVKRMFLYMAKKTKHRWYEKLDLSKINLGSGTRSYAKGGIKDSIFNIVIPRELAYYD